MLALALLLCDGARALVVPQGVKSIEAGAFQGSTALTEVVLSASVASVGAFAFADCENLTEITIKNPKAALGENALGRAGEARTIYGAFSSTARLYASAYGFAFESIPGDATALLEYAYSLLGQPYVSGSLDCVLYAYRCYLKTTGIKIEDTCPGVRNSTKGLLVETIEDLVPGDVICWKSDGESTRCTHVGIYVGAGMLNGRAYTRGIFIEASYGAGKVRLNYLPAEGTSWYVRNFLCARRYM